MTADALGLEYSTDASLREIDTGGFGGLLIADIRIGFQMLSMIGIGGMVALLMANRGLIWRLGLVHSLQSRVFWM